ncbi:MAG: transporter substrate-binding domain-containing protein [Bdellovibrionota bacterium]|nr:transporter substrate-binding domain-containing protein [Bdellovibrionota bacterium]
MSKAFRNLLLGLPLSFIFINASEHLLADLPNSNIKVNFSTTEWCPYICNNESKPGFAVEYIQQIFDQANLKMDYKIMPWSRAIFLAKQGKEFDGLLTVSSTEAPGMKLTHNPSFSYRACFYGKKTFAWKYENLDSIKEIRLGAIQSYGYSDELDKYISSKPQNVELISDRDSLTRFSKLLDSNRIDVFVGDQNVVHYQTKLEKIKELGCLPTNQVYIAINPKYKHVDEVIKRLDDALKKKANQELYLELKNKYLKNQKLSEHSFHRL